MSAPSYQELEKGHPVNPIPSKQPITPESTLAALKANIDTTQALHVRTKQELKDAERLYQEANSNSAEGRARAAASWKHDVSLLAAHILIGLCFWWALSAAG
ncbi:unnamed protein product [Zymoseptoria tritici ST99CH_1A5]|uniref:Uncharacterized protein n=1 Tax=Zymoseptoria tritici ST99CH_1A5 TaxID=1276529 RepID=A0A1Y6LSU9_ZYMTR|nr:unnamed protein product [Zymoseptoria tritici ST99CH_1A5]